MEKNIKKMSKQDIVILMIYLGLYMIIGLILLIKQPFGSPPDEYNRFLIPQYIAEHGTIPNGYDEAIRIHGYGFSYGFQPILPYMLQGYAMRFVRIFTTDFMTLLYTARSVDLFLGLLNAIGVFMLGRLWFMDRRFVWIFAVLATFLPQSIFVHTYVNTDSCCLLSITVMLCAITQGMRRGFGIKTDCLLALGVILCALSYYNAYGYILSCILLFTASFIKRTDGRLRLDWKPFIKNGLFIAAVVLAAISWWFIRSAILYNGDFIGLRSRDVCAMQYATPEFRPDTRQTRQRMGYSIFDMIFKSDFCNLTVLSFIAMYGAMAIPANIWLYRFYKYFLLITLVAMVVIRTKKIKRILPDSMLEKKAMNIFFHANMVFCALLPALLSLWYSYTTDYQPQGRYILPSLIPVMLYSTKGLEKLIHFVIPEKLREKKLKTGTALSDRIINVMTIVVIVIIVAMLFWMVLGSALPYYRAHPIAD